ncbi:class I SAM-dependent methyltransferase [Sulfurimonas sp. HSL3-7]|uniref:class I SAM-dependent methyltransferase n=1 Tax=Sulfonitrofixus jiaomeiensis TaxID=3131938 RepID=UPI0031F921C3
MKKTEQKPFDHQKARQEATSWFDDHYKEANKELSAVAWAKGRTNPLLQEYLETSYPVPSKAIVIGCGLGDDANALYEAGFDVTAIDISPEAIKWAKERFGETTIDFRVADLFDLPQELLGKFDFVFEAFTIQALPLSLRDSVITAIASLMAPYAKVLAVCNAKRDDEYFDGPPWPLTTNELRLFTMKECKELEFSIYEEQSHLSSLKVRAVFQKEN